ncbi:Transcription initiation factor TFIID subunit 9B [Sparganum proliferum]
MTDSDRQNESQTSPFAVIKSIFEDFNLTEYTGEILTEARALANYSGRSKITESDVRLAVDSKAEQLILTPLHREQLLEYAEKVNSQPLPPIKPGHGIRLGPEKYTLTAPNFTITTSSPSSVDNGFTQSSAASTGQVASRITLPGTGSGVTVFRVASAAPGHLPNLIPAAEADITTTVGGTSSGLHVIAPVAAPASLIRVQSGNPPGTVVSPVLPLTKANTGVAQPSNIHRRPGDEH